MARLWGYMRRVVDEAECLQAPELADRKELILRNCTVLMVSAVAEQPRLVSGAFRRSLERRWPIGFRAMRTLRRFARGRFGRVREEIVRRRRVDDPFDLIEG